MTLEAARQRVEEMSQNTLGQLMRDLKGRTNIETSTERLLQEFLSERNWLVHRLDRENGLDRFDQDRHARLIDRLIDVEKRATHLQREFVKLATAFTMQKTGLTKEQLDAETLRTVKQRTGQ
jgi:hypothetical protein